MNTREELKAEARELDAMMARHKQVKLHADSLSFASEGYVLARSWEREMWAVLGPMVEDFCDRWNEMIEAEEEEARIAARDARWREEVAREERVNFALAVHKASKAI